MCQFFSQCSQAPMVGVSGYFVSGNSSMIGFWQPERINAKISHFMLNRLLLKLMGLARSH